MLKLAPLSCLSFCLCITYSIRVINLRLSSKNKWLGGFFGGLGKYTKINPDFLRLIYLGLFCFTHFGGALLFAYAIAVLIIPEEEKE